MAQEFFNASQEELIRMKKIIKNFHIPDGKIISVEPITNGRLNKSYKVSYHTIEGYRLLVVQQVNHKIFTDPCGLMRNIGLVTDYIRVNGGDTLFFHKSTGGAYPGTLLYYDKEKDEYWRLDDFVEADVKNEVECEDDMFNLGLAIREFSNSLNGFDPSYLVETIKDFHNTPERFKHFMVTVATDTYMHGNSRGSTCEDEICWVINNSKYADVITKPLSKGAIPTRVSHNDTKLNNVLFRKSTGKVLCLCDLDTVMPGSVLFDVGDALRYGCNSASEEETDLSKVSFNLEYFKSLVKGFLSLGRENITEEEVKLIPDSARVMTYELAVRFLDDHIAGNTYFGVPYDGKNLERAKVQMALCDDITNKFDEMVKIVEEAWAEAK